VERQDPLGSEEYGGSGNLNAPDEAAGQAASSASGDASSKHWAGSPRHGSLALATTHGEASALPAWRGSEWFDSFQAWINEFSTDGRFAPGPPMSPTDDKRSAYATLAPRLRLAAGESATVTFVLAWHFPSRENDWNPSRR
jgi:hypothetical protein